MRSPWFWAAMIVAVVAASCGRSESEAPKSEEKSELAEGAMCAEHGVLEAICTKCNPKLIPVFKAKGDWCEEHGFPMSVCPVHHPERGGKPAANVGKDAAPADGTKVRLQNKETEKRAGIETAKAEARAGGARLEVVARISYDARKRAEINARAVGVVKKLHVDVGDRVAATAPLALIESATVGADRARVTAAASRVRVAQETLRREQALAAKGISPKKDVLAAEQELDAAKAEQAAAQAAVGVVGGGGASSYVLRAPLAGTVTARRVSIGHMVDLEESLFEIVDVSGMWAELDVPEAELALVLAGQEATVTLEGLPGKTFRGRITYVAPAIDPETRTARARVALSNPDGALRANMFGHAAIELGAARTSVMIPRAAVQRVEDVEIAFVALAPGEYETRRIKTGALSGESVEVVEGIKEGEPVVTTGSFLLKTETLKGSIGAGCCE